MVARVGCVGVYGSIKFQVISELIVSVFVNIGLGTFTDMRYITLLASFKNVFGVVCITDITGDLAIVSFVFYQFPLLSLMNIIVLPCAAQCTP